jgi:hypothetical protein
MYLLPPSRGPALDQGSARFQALSITPIGMSRLSLVKRTAFREPRPTKSRPTRLLAPAQRSNHDPKRHHPRVIESDAAIGKNPRAANLALPIAEQSKGLIHGCYNSAH